jgi:hypothetical protein
LVYDFARVIDLIIFNTLWLQVFRASIAGLIEVQLLLLCVFSCLVLIILLFISIWIFGFQIVFVWIGIGCIVIEIFLIYWMIYTWCFHLFSTSSLIGSIVARWTTTNSCTAREWSRLWSSLVLLFLESIKSRTLQATLQISLRFTMMTTYAPFECDCLLQRHQLSNTLFLRSAYCNACVCWITSLAIILIFV